MSCAEGDIYASVLEFEEVIRQLKGDTLTEVDDDHYRKIMGLSVQQMRALGTLNRLMTDRTEGIPLKMLAQYMKLSLPAASHLVDSMVKKGLFNRKENPNDRRSICIKLSEEGERNFQFLHRTTQKRVEVLFSCLSAEEQTNFRRIIAIITDRFYNN